MALVRLIVLRRVMLAASLGLGFNAYAELVYQPPPGTPADDVWRMAGSSLLEGIARIFDGLAAIETKKNSPSASKYFDDGISRLQRSTDAYAKLAETTKSPRKISIQSLSAERREVVGRTFESYKVPIPTDEAASARLGAYEVRSFLSVFKENRDKVASADLLAVQRVLSAVTRLQRLGTSAAELLSEK